MRDHWQPHFTQKDVEIETNEVVFQDHFSVSKLKLRFKLFQGGWSPTISRVRMNKCAAAAVLLYNPFKKTVTMVEQFRIGALNYDSPWILEPVAGLIEPGHQAAETAHRESLEEADCHIHTLIPICKYLVSSGASDEITTLFCGLTYASEPDSIHGLEHEAENIKVIELPAKHAFQLVSTGKIFAASAIISLQWLELNFDNLNEKYAHQAEK